MTLQEILNLLREGKKLQQKFSNSGDREKFRTALYRKKKEEDSYLQNILDEDKLTLRWEPSEIVEDSSDPLSIPVAKFWLEKKSSDVNYEVEVLDE